MSKGHQYNQNCSKLSLSMLFNWNIAHNYLCCQDTDDGTIMNKRQAIYLIVVEDRHGSLNRFLCIYIDNGCTHYILLRNVEWSSVLSYGSENNVSFRDNSDWDSLTSVALRWVTTKCIVLVTAKLFSSLINCHVPSGSLFRTASSVLDIWPPLSGLPEMSWCLPGFHQKAQLLIFSYICRGIWQKLALVNKRRKVMTMPAAAVNFRKSYPATRGLLLFEPPRLI